jgi:hypothetical protein
MRYVFAEFLPFILATSDTVSNNPTLQGLVKNQFTLTEVMLFGALLQLALSVILPARYALLPTLFILLRTVITTVLQARSPKDNMFVAGTMPTKTSAQLPPQSTYDPRSGTPYGSVPSQKGVVVLHLGVRFNHPLGLFSPGAKTVSEFFMKCNATLLDRAKEFGCLGVSNFTGEERAKNNTMLSIFYFRDIEGLHAFARDPVHRETWEWYERFSRRMGCTHIGVFHEIFATPPGGYECVYRNCPPMLLAMGNVPVTNEATGEDEWVSPFVDADRRELSSSKARLGKGVVAEEVEKFVV